jgi:hypothetical protein
MQVSGVLNSAISVASSAPSLWDEEGGPSFSDFLDLINPLQHIPVISNLYQQETGDKIGAVAKVTGATAIGGPIGGIIAVANEVFEAVTGNDVAGHLMGFMGLNNKAPGKTEVIIPSQEQAMLEPAPRRVTTKEWIYGINA